MILVKAVVLASFCYSSFLDGTSCKTTLKVISGELSGQLCESSFAASKGDSVLVTFKYNNCQMR